MELISSNSTLISKNPVGHNFYPYTDNGGTCVAVAGKNFVVIASDTRLSEGYSIHSREQPKIFKLTGSTVLASTGCWCDVLTFVKLLQARIKLYYYDHREAMSTQAVAQIVSNTLYSKRFFPYYISNIVAGLDEEGIGAVYGYDPVGSFDRTTYLASGSSASLIQPFLDNQIGPKNLAKYEVIERSLEEIKLLVKDSFISASERDIYCGDSIFIQTITKDGFQTETFSLRKD